MKKLSFLVGLVIASCMAMLLVDSFAFDSDLVPAAYIANVSSVEESAEIIHAVDSVALAVATTGYLDRPGAQPLTMSNHAPFSYQSLALLADYPAGIYAKPEVGWRS